MLEWTGERYLPNVDPSVCGVEIHYEHLHRYAFASQYAKNKKVLDLASGEGFGTSILSKNARCVIGIDIDHEAVLHASTTYNSGNISFIEGSILNIPIAGRKIFDVIVCFEAIEHVSEHAILFQEIQRLLKDDGILIISTPNKKTYSDDVSYKNPYHKRELYYSEFYDLLKKNFNYINVFGQLTISGSSIYPVSPREMTISFSEFDIKHGGDRFSFLDEDEKESRYFIAIASKTQLYPHGMQKSYLIDKSNTGITILNTQISRCNTAIECLTQALSTKDQQLQSLSQAVNTKDQQLQSLSQAVNTKDQQLQEQIARVYTLGQKISSIENSIVWQLTMKFHTKVIERLLPQNTQRRRYYDLGLRGGKILIHEGWGSFWWNFKGHLHSNKKQINKGPLDHPQIMDTIPNPNNLSDVNNIETLTFALPVAPIVSIIIPVYNKWQFTYTCLKSILENTANITYEVIIADDCSLDQTDKMLKKIEGIKTIKNKNNLGYLKNCNNAAKFADGQYVVYLNNDTYVMKGWLESLLEPAIRNDNVGVVGPNIISADGKLLENGWIIGIDGWGQPIGRGDDPSKYEYNYVKEVDCVTGTCLLIRKDIFIKAGLFDESFSPAYYEEFDFAFSVRKMGYKVFVHPKSHVIHYDNSTYGKEKRDQLSVINHQKFMDRWKNEVQKHPAQYYEYFLARDRSQYNKILLIIDDKVPDYDKYAGSLMMFQYVKLFQEIGFKVIFLPDNLVKSEPYTFELQQEGVEVIYGNFDFDSWIEKNGKYLDIILLSRPLVSIKYIDKIKKNSQAKILYSMVDLHYLRELRRYEVERKEFILKESQKLKEIEFSLFKKADIILTLSTAEAHILSAELPELHTVEVIPIFIFDEFRANSSFSSFDQRKDLIFLGGFGHLPNVDAVDWFVKKCFPLIISQIPDIKFYIVGSNPPQEIKNLASDNIVVTGQVDELTPFFEKTRVFVSPLRYGAGVKGKLVTSMYHGVPIVTTSIGAEGLGIIDKETALVADDADTFASKVVELYTNKELWEKISQKGLHYIEETCSKSRVREKILKILKFNTCHICGALFEYPEPPYKIENLRETTLCNKCKAIKRWDDVARVLIGVIGTKSHCLWDAQQDLNKFTFYLNESSGPIYNSLSKTPHFECSEFWDDVPPGTLKNNVRCEDVTALTYADETFDIVISQDVFEHVSDPEKGFSEIYRVLKTGGYHIFTVPFDKSLSHTRRRVRIVNGKVEHILPPIYHGDLIRSGGSLVFSDFGMDLEEILKKTGFDVDIFEDNHPEYVGGYNIVFICKRKSGTAKITDPIADISINDVVTEDKGGLICLYPFYVMCIFENYNIYNCVCLDWIKQSIGTLKTNSLAECWNSDLSRFIRRKMYAGEWKEICNPICPIIVEHKRSGKIIKYEDLESIYEITPELADEIRAGKDRLDSPPSLFKLDNSVVCNLHCIMCSKDLFKDDPLLQDKMMQELQNYLPSVKKLILCGVGDPLARPDTRDILMNHTGSIKFDLITNGLLLPKYWDKIKHQRYGILIISVDGATKKTYEKIRAGGKWENLLNSLSLIEKNKNAFENIMMNMTVMRSNYKEIPRFIDLAESYGFNVLFHGIRGAYPDENIFEPKDFEAINELKKIVADETTKKRSIKVSLSEIEIYLN